MICGPPFRLCWSPLFSKRLSLTRLSTCTNPVRSTTTGSAKTSVANKTVTGYLTFILYSVFLLARALSSHLYEQPRLSLTLVPLFSGVRFIGSTTYKIVRLFAGEWDREKSWSFGVLERWLSTIDYRLSRFVWSRLASEHVTSACQWWLTQTCITT